MAVNRWLGHAAPVAQVVTLTVGSATSGHTFVTTIAGAPISYAAGSGETTSTVAAAIKALLAASTDPRFTEVTWTVDAAVITGTAKTAGKPFTVSESGTGTYTLATATASSGPNHYGNGTNWSQGAEPQTGEDVLIDGGPDILWGLENQAASDFASLRILASFTGRVGLPYRDESGDYVQYRGRRLAVATAVPVTIGEGEGSGPTLVNIGITTAAAVAVLATGSRALPDVPAVNLSGCGSGTLDVATGDVGVCADDDTLTATVTTTRTNDGAALVVGKGATLTTLHHGGGAVLNRGTVTTLNQSSGTFTSYGTATTVTVDPASDAETLFDWRSSVTITTATFRGQPGAPAPQLECGNDPRARTITNGTFTGGAILHDPDKLTTWSNPLNFDRASMAASDVGSRFTLARV